MFGGDEIAVVVASEAVAGGFMANGAAVTGLVAIPHGKGYGITADIRLGYELFMHHDAAVVVPEILAVEHGKSQLKT